MSKVALVPRESLVRMEGWESLDEVTQASVVTETEGLVRATAGHAFSQLAMGEHLHNVESLLVSRRMFHEYLGYFPFSIKSAYRYRDSFRAMEKRFPKNVRDAALAAGVNFSRPTPEKPLGDYTYFVDVNPPPKTEDPKKVEAYVRKMIEGRKEALRARHSTSATRSANQEALLKETYRILSGRYKRLPNNSRTRSSWVRNLVGMLLTDLGVSGAQTYEPVAVPEGYRAKRGRPRSADREPEAG